MRYLLDTNVCIDVLRKREPVISRMALVPRHACAVSTVTTYELLTGAKKSADPVGEIAKIRYFVMSLHELAFGPFEANHAAQVRADLERRGIVIGPYDLLLAGHALSRGLTLVTDNAREFSRVEGLSIENWRTI